MTSPFLKEFQSRPRLYAVYKPVGPTSSDIVGQFKGKLYKTFSEIFPLSEVKKAFKKVGHLGTLDPFAEGLLLIGVGPALRITNYTHTELTKTYKAIGELGISSDTGDVTGQLSEEDSSLEWGKIAGFFSSESDKSNLRSKFLGPYQQAPPIYSAAKYQGRPLYEWKRKFDQEIIRPKVDRTIHKLDFVDFHQRELTLIAEVSGGTYIRVLFEDIAKELGTSGYLKGLIRTHIGAVSIEHDDLIDDINQLTVDAFLERSLNIDEILPFKKYDLSLAQAISFLHGRKLEGFKEDELIWPKYQDMILGLARGGQDTKLTPQFVFPFAQEILLK